MTENKTIYIADDEINICSIIKSFLIKEGYEVESFNDGRTLLEAFASKPADMLIVDIMMPHVDGYSICSEIRRTSSVPIIFVSARDTETDKIAGLALGGDDYLTKPFSPMELIARVKSIFRRIGMDKEDGREKGYASRGLDIADVAADPGSKRAICKGKDIGLTVMEFNLLHYLMENRNRAVGRSELLNRIWGFENAVETRATDDMIKRIRRKLSDSGSRLEIKTVWGFGFMIKDRE